MERAPMVGRASQVSMLTDAVRDAQDGRARVVVVTGQAGIGKSTLLDAVADRLPATTRLLRTAGHAAESGLADAGIHHLLHTAGLDLPTPSHGGDPLATVSHLLHALTAAARRCPLVIMVDDAQWLDPSSRRALVFVARRIDADSICLVLAVRTPTDVDLDVGTRLDVGPLPDTDAHELLRISFPRMNARVAARVVDHAHGLPLALHEIPLELSRAQRAGLEPLPTDLPVGRSVSELFARRLDSLGERCRRALLAAAYDPLDAGAYHAVLTRLGCGLDDLDEAERLQLARVRDGRCEFRHPLVAAAVRERAYVQELRDVHRALAAQLRHDPVRHAAHVLADPAADPGVRAAAARTGAVAARSAHAFATATELWRAVAGLATDQAAKSAALADAVECAVRAGAGTEAETMIRDLLPVTGGVARAALLRHRLAIALWTSATLPQGEEDIGSEAAAMAADTDERVAGAGRELLVALAIAAFGTGHFGRAHEICRTLRTHAGDRIGVEERLLCDVTAVMVGHPGAGAELRGSWEDHYPWHTVLDPASPIGFITTVLTWLDEHQTVRRVLDRCTRVSADNGTSVAVHYVTGTLRANLDRHLGRWEHARSEYRTLERLITDTDFAAPYPFVALRHAHLLASRGLADECEQVRARARARAPAWIPILEHLDRSVAGLLALAQRDFAAAADHLEAAAAVERSVGLVPSGFLSRQADAFEAAWRLGRVDDQLPHLTRFEAAMAEIGHRQMSALALRCRALVAPADLMDDLFARAVRDLRGLPDGFEAARTELLWGERRRRARRKADANRVLTSARATFVRLGATGWVERCDSELAACGVRRARGPAAESGPGALLTPREFEVAREVAAGATNARAAQRLFISERTVEFHLANVFRKLDINEREALAQLLAG